MTKYFEAVRFSIPLFPHTENVLDRCPRNVSEAA